MNTENKKVVLDLINEWWETEDIPQEVMLARVVIILNKEILAFVKITDQFLY